jgi:hypothetical protein
VLVNNAGYALWKPLEATTIAEWGHTFAVTVRAAAYLSAAVLPGVAARRFGRIINIGSEADLGHRPRPSRLLRQQARPDLAGEVERARLRPGDLEHAVGVADTDLLSGFRVRLVGFVTRADLDHGVGPIARGDPHVADAEFGRDRNRSGVS